MDESTVRVKVGGVVFLMVVICSALVAPTTSNSITGRPPRQCLSNANIIGNTIRVGVGGSGSRSRFARVQDAINAIPSNNIRWIRVLVNPGTYIEQVHIPADKQCVVIQGNSPLDTIISYNAHGATDSTATFTSSAHNLVALNIAFINSYKGPNVKPAIAARVYGDKSAFYNCRFVGIQDTLWDVGGRHYFKSCYIQGAVDFIWGRGQSVYEDCEMNVTAQVLGRSVWAGYITAQGRKARTDPSGFVFIRGSVYGSGKAYLGRAYGAFSRVIFRETNMGNVVLPLGWDAWNYVHNQGHIMYAEASCRGRGAGLSHRVGWMKRVDLSKYTVPTFIDPDGWIAKQPIQQHTLSS